MQSLVSTGGTWIHKSKQFKRKDKTKHMNTIDKWYCENHGNLSFNIQILKHRFKNDIHFVFTYCCLSYLYYLCLFSHSAVQHILSCVFLRLVYPLLPVSLDCPFLITPSVFYNVYLMTTILLHLWYFPIVIQSAVDNINITLKQILFLLKLKFKLISIIYYCIRYKGCRHFDIAQ